MPPRSDPAAPVDPRSAAIEVAAIAHVLDTLTARAAESEPSDPVESAPEANALEDMVARAVAELGSQPTVRPWSIGVATSAPVLGSGVLQRLIAARRREQAGA